MTAALDKLIDWYSSLSPETLKRIDDFYTADAYFKDPFNEFRSRDSIRNVFVHMFHTLEQPRFHISGAVTQDRESFIRWDMKFILRGRAMSIHGCSHLVFNEDGRISYHRDYWDSAEELYEKLPLLGWLMKQLKRKLQSTQG